MFVQVRNSTGRGLVRRKESHGHRKPTACNGLLSYSFGKYSGLCWARNQEEHTVPTGMFVDESQLPVGSCVPNIEGHWDVLAAGYAQDLQRCL
jgi:hypothetical protein